jgi:hypothetical protein
MKMEEEKGVEDEGGGDERGRLRSMEEFNMSVLVSCAHWVDIHLVTDALHFKE